MYYIYGHVKYLHWHLVCHCIKEIKTVVAFNKISILPTDTQSASAIQPTNNPIEQTHTSLMILF